LYVKGGGGERYREGRGKQTSRKEEGGDKKRRAERTGTKRISKGLSHQLEFS
jgi:hypothetical protein